MPDSSASSATLESSPPAATEAPTLRNYAGGEWVAAAAESTLADVDPATGATLAQVPLSTAADVERAVAAARQAQPAWRAVSPQGRARALMELRRVLDAHRDELAARLGAVLQVRGVERLGDIWRELMA
ncbi:MAG TPA: aldehyde dehydrogenase family protein, partial [Solirubrobacterales bacterium]|nr:aldehyde dehydrogenase family protein [Solirubrobacterales bacterium]